MTCLSLHEKVVKCNYGPFICNWKQRFIIIILNWWHKKEIQWPAAAKQSYLTLHQLNHCSCVHEISVPVTSLPKAHGSIISAWQIPKAQENTTNNWHLQTNGLGRQKLQQSLFIDTWYSALGSGFLAGRKTATWVNWSGLQFQKTPWSWERTGI